MKCVSVLFSEPKIPQYEDACEYVADTFRFQCSSASRKFLNQAKCQLRYHQYPVSVLFSEPKIPQFVSRRAVAAFHMCFSALQRAENSSIVRVCELKTTRAAFQCSSASRKFLNEKYPSETFCRCRVSVLFSEPKIPQS